MNQTKSQSLVNSSPKKNPPPIQKGQNPKKYIMQNFEELKFVDNIGCLQRGQLRLFRFHPFVKYMASKLVCSIPKNSLSTEQADQLLIQYQERCKIRQPHIIYSIASESQTITKNSQSQGQVELFQIFLFFEFSQLTLDYLTEKRRVQKFLLPEPEVWCLLQGIISALSFFQLQNISHGMISAKNIYFDEEYLLYRIYDQELINGRWGNWNKIFNFKKGKPQTDFTQTDYLEIIQYLAPETQKYFDFDSPQIDGKVSPYKADVYSFGYQYYNNQKYKDMKQNMPQEKQLEWIGQFYSKDLVEFIKTFTESHPVNRPDWIVLQSKIKEVPENIQKLNQTLKVIQKKKNDDDQYHNNSTLIDQSFSLINQSMSQKGESEIDQKLVQLNKKIQETLTKSFSKTKSLK